MTPSTITNVLLEEWALRDEVTRLRVWGSDRVFPLLSDTREPYTIGTATTCSIRIEDPERRASRDHARLERIQDRWGVIDHGSKNGLYRNGARVDKLALSPGVEIGRGGGVVLVAESERWIALRNLVSRMLGWSADRAMAVDLALREIRLAAMRRVVLVLCGEHDLVPLAKELHRATLTAARPFVLCNPRRRGSDTPEDSPESMNSGVDAVQAAAGGTVCLLHKNLPSDLNDMLDELRRPECQTQLVMCAERARASELFAATPVIIPRLAARKAEVDRIIDEYVAEAAASMGIGERWLRPAERVWIRDRQGDSLPDIQTAVTRLAAIRRAGSISAGAIRVGISHTGMLKWLRTQEYPELELLRASNNVPGATFNGR